MEKRRRDRNRKWKEMISEALHQNIAYIIFFTGTVIAIIVQ